MEKSFVDDMAQYLPQFGFKRFMNWTLGLLGAIALFSGIGMVKSLKR